ncbi:MAG: sigma 54-interacting transcriptional regulator [Deltaproteobacteria bacterium]|nr:sigma 54-interacting transcriptional regulator [Deltaproteobacteria bacterium]
MISPKGMPRGELVFRRGAQDLLRVRIDRAETCIGSHPTNDVVVPDPTLPSVAAILVDRGASRYKLRDLTGSILVNDQKVEADEVELTEGSKIGLGSYVLELRVRPDEEPPVRHTTVLEGATSAVESARLRYGDRELTLKSGRPFNIGTDEDNDLELEDEFVSSFHCRITSSGGRWTIVDLASTNGTRVNGLRVGEAELPRRATIELGTARIEFDSTPDDAPVQDIEVFGGMIAASAKMRRVFDVVRRLARADAPVLILGDSGCGKELVARALHDQGPRAAAPFLALNCGALAGTVIESELFGHARGAFTGADRDRKGAFEAVENGTLFLDEIGELPLDLQPKLLRALEVKSIRRVGGTQEIPFAARIVAATHKNLRELVDQGRFREDLFHRLFVLNVTVPKLSERPEDVLPIARHFVKSLSGGTHSLTPEAERSLVRYRWPGNVRELKNVILRAVLLSDAHVIGAEALEFSEAAFSREVDVHRHVRSADELDRQKIARVLEECGGNRAEAARQLGLSKSTFHDRLRRLGIPAKFVKP